MGKLYTEKSIETLDPLSFTRLKPGVYCGDTTYSTQLLVEIISNSIDEFRNGFGNEINIVNTGKILEVRDYGQGFIYSMRDDGKSILEAAFSVLNTSGKYREDGTYEGTSLGSFGIGSKLCNFLSNWLIVSSYRDGQVETIRFEEGVFHSRVIKPTKAPNGTKVIWQPSAEFFAHPEVEESKILDLLKTSSCLCPNLKITYQNSKQNMVFYSKRGLQDLVDEKATNEILKNRLNIQFQDGKYKMDLVLTYTSNYSSTIIPYVNTGLTESGQHITQLKTCLTRELNKFFKAKKILKEKDENLSGEDIQEGLFLVFNITAPNVSYDAQVKSRITAIETKPFTSAFASAIQNWCSKNEKEVRAIAEKAINAKKARNAAKKARDKIRKPEEKGLKAKMKLSNKFIDCISKNTKERNLLIVEGLSAGSAAIEARNVQTDCIYMLRGKTISPLKATIDKILANQELSDIINVIGGGFGNDNFDINKMNFNKIVITSDQDSDGLAIELLLITFFYTYMRPLVLAGKLYRAVTPLYIVRTKKEELYFYSDDELQDWKDSNKMKYDLIRAKGLGELNAEDLRKVCFEQERFKRITVSDIEETNNLLEILQGKAVEPRKQYIYENADTLGFNFN